MKKKESPFKCVAGASFTKFGDPKPKKKPDTLKFKQPSQEDLGLLSAIPKEKDKYKPMAFNMETTALPRIPIMSPATAIDSGFETNGLVENYDYASNYQQHPQPEDQNSPWWDRNRGQLPDINPSMSIATGLAAIDAIIPGEPIKRRNTVQPAQGYNPNPYGTGSQAISKAGIHIKASKRGTLHDAVGVDRDKKIPSSKLTIHEGDSPSLKKKKQFAQNAKKWKHEAGGDLKPEKAKEMLRDGTAHGKKLTKKQRGFFGLVAAGKADAGLSMGPDPAKPVNGVPTRGKTEGIYNPTAKDLDNVELSELISYNLVNGGNPLENMHGRSLFQRASDQFGQGDAQQLISEISLFNQDAGNKSMSPDQKIQRYFSLPQNSKIKNTVNKYGYGPTDIYNGSSDVESQKQQGRGLLTQMDAGGSIKQLSHNPYDGGTKEFVGDSHEEGGIDINYDGTNVEVEGAETGVAGPDGSFNIMGNMSIPGTKTKFKTVSKNIAKQENKYTKLMQKGEANYNVEIEGHNKFDRLKAATGKIMMTGADIGFKDLAAKKQYLSDMQNAILSEADEAGYDPISYSEGGKRKAKNGAKIMAAGGPGPKKKKLSALEQMVENNKQWLEAAQNTPKTIPQDGPGLTSWSDTFAPATEEPTDGEDSDMFLSSIKRKIGDAESSGRYDVASSV